MKIETVKEFYVSELVGMSFIERYSYELLNKWTVDTGKFKISLNPLRWCLLDFMLVSCFVLLLIVVALTLVPYLAHKAKEKYKDEKYVGRYQHNIKILRF